MSRTVVVVGGGIAGISCIEALIQDFEQDFTHAILISESKLIKRVSEYKISGRNLEEFNVIQDDVNLFFDHKMPSGLKFEHIAGVVECVDYSAGALEIKCNSSQTSSCIKTISFDKLCLCLGSRPKELEIELKHPELSNRIIVIRDTTTVEDLKAKLNNCRRIVIVGNGGISLELVDKISNCEKFWIIRDKSIGMTFFDSGAGKFLLDAQKTSNSRDDRNLQETYRIASFQDQSFRQETSDKFGPALGPDWLQDLRIQGKLDSTNDLNIIYDDEVIDINISSSEKFPVIVSTKSSQMINCDLVAIAIGVQPNSVKFIGDLPKLDEANGGILIDEQMRTSLPNVYAAGDVVSCSRWPSNELFLQMRLWTQARQMGFYAGRCIAAHIRHQDPTIYFNFDCFTHCTKFFGHRLVLLGQYNGQLLNVDEAKQCEVIARVNPTKDYVKILIKDGRIIGAVLVGDSGLEETIENLIYDRIDISAYKNQLLDGSVDIEDYFD